MPRPRISRGAEYSVTDGWPGRASERLEVGYGRDDMNRAAGDLVTVVTPVFNGGLHLAQCLDSVIAQTYDNWVHVIVDNASSDRTSDIAIEYAKRDERIRYYRFDDYLEINDNHNRAFRYTDPESIWCKPLMADDWLYPECLERMVRQGTTSTSIGVVSAYQRWGDDVRLTSLPTSETVVPGHELLRRMLLSRINVTGSPTALMHRSEVVLASSAFYDRDLEHADTEAALRVLLEHDLGFVHQVLSVSRRPARGTYLEWAWSRGSEVAEEFVWVTRYGRRVLTETEYLEVYRARLRKLAWYLAKQAVRPSRRSDPTFWAYHDGLARMVDPAAQPPDRYSAGLLLFVKKLVGSQVEGDPHC